jgi:hypothetical protein
MPVSCLGEDCSGAGWTAGAANRLKTNDVVTMVRLFTGFLLAIADRVTT